MSSTVRKVEIPKPQSSPLSPLLPNIVLNELDKDLTSRGHLFVRYADDCSIYAGSEKSARRFMGSITAYIEGELKLKVNRVKSKVSRSVDSTLLVFSFYRSQEKWEIRIAPKSLDKLKKKIKQHTRRKDPAPARDKIVKLEAMLRGWVNYVVIARAKSKMEETKDEAYEPS